MVVGLISRAIEAMTPEKLIFMNKDAEVLDVEASQLKRIGKCRPKTIKAEYPPDSWGADTDADQNGHGLATSREEKVSSLKTVSSFHIIIIVNSSTRERTTGKKHQGNSQTLLLELMKSLSGLILSHARFFEKE